MKSFTVFQVLKPLIQFLDRKTAFVFGFLRKHYTPLAVVVLAITGTIVLFVTSYLFRYNHWNYWLWKSRAVTQALYFCIVLIAMKLLIGVV